MTLYIVGTPPLATWKTSRFAPCGYCAIVSLIAAENTRKAGILLSHYQITTPLTSYYEGNERRRIPEILEALERGDVALISEAGMPGYRILATTHRGCDSTWCVGCSCPWPFGSRVSPGGVWPADRPVPVRRIPAA